MKKYLSLIVVVLFAAVAGGLGFSAVTATDPQPQAIANQIIAREKASVEAWQRKDKAFWADFLADDATYFGAMSPYLETDPKVNFRPASPAGKSSLSRSPVSRCATK